MAARGFAQVALVAANTAFIARGDTLAVGVAGFAISWCWWGNTGRAAHDLHNRRHRLAYSAGAALGAVAGMRLVGLL